jgi:putative ABC transport system permease protein
MLGRLILRSLTRRPGRRALAAAAVALGTSVVVALVAVASDVGDRIARELRAGGANIVLVPQGRAGAAALPGGSLTVPLPGPLLAEQRVPEILTTFWANNIVSVSPVLEVAAHLQRSDQPPADLLLVGTHFDSELESPRSAGPCPMGLLKIAPYALLTGRIPSRRATREGSTPEAVIGVSLAARLGVAPGSRLDLAAPRPDGTAGLLSLTLVGTVSTGGEEDDRLYAPLTLVQQASGQPGLVSRVLVSALLAPEDRLYARAMQGLESLSPEEHEIFVCRAYPLPVARDFADALPGAEGRPLLKTADAEGHIVEGMRWITAFVAAAVIVSSVLAVLAALATSIVERRREVGLVKALGASRPQVLTPFLAETGVTGLVGGVAGFGLGALLARWIGVAIFGRPALISGLLFAPALVVATALAVLGSLVPLSAVLRLDPAAVLKGD